MSALFALGDMSPGTKAVRQLQDCTPSGAVRMLDSKSPNLVFFLSQKFPISLAKPSQATEAVG